MNNSERPAIPEKIKRAVRQQCCFGCAICGIPFFQYDHVQEYAEVKEHTADNLVLLCPNHHSAKTTKKLSIERISAAKANPFNANRQFTSPFKIEPSKEITVLLGSNKFTGWYPTKHSEHHAIWINGEGGFVIHSSNGWLCVSFILTDHEGNVLFSVCKGEVQVSTCEWDFTYVGNSIKVRLGVGEILFDLILSDNRVEILKGAFFDSKKNGYIIDNGSLLLLSNGNMRSFIAGGTYSCNGFGGLGLLNKADYPDITMPSGFGSSHTC